MKKRTCLQIGLKYTAECLYLAHPDPGRVKVENLTHPHEINYLEEVPVPEMWEADDWRYIGVDGSIKSIDYLSEKYRVSEKYQWLVARVGKETCVSTSTRDIPHLVPQFSLRDLLCHLKITELDILVVDIEGGEFPLFEGYDFSIKPELIYVEFHSFEGGVKSHSGASKERLMDIICPYGYKVDAGRSTSKHVAFVENRWEH